MSDQGQCINSTGSTCSATRCDCEAIKPQEMESLDDIKIYQKSVILESLCEAPIKRDVLRDSLPFFLSDRRMRNLIMELIRDGEPIASSETGYFIIKNVRQLTETVEYLKSKARAISIRGNTLIGNFDRKYQEPVPSSLQFKLF